MRKHKYKLITIATLFTFATAVIHIINKLIFASATAKNMLKVNADHHYNWRFGKIYYDKKGEGSPILLVHDLTVHSSNYEWKNMIDKLSEKHTVYSIDLLGCGRSDKQALTYTNYMYVQIISDFIKNVIGKKTDIITCGFSSSFVIMACHNEKDIFGKIMLINPPDIAELNKTPNKRTKLLKVLLETPILGTLVYNMLNTRGNIELLFTEQYFYNPFHSKNEIVDTYFESAHRGAGNAKFLSASIMGRFINNNIFHALKSINTSIFIVGGAEEQDIQETIQKYTDCNPAIESAILPKSKHLPQLETPEQLLEQVEIFF